MVTKKDAVIKQFMVNLDYVSSDLISYCIELIDWLQ